MRKAAPFEIIVPFMEQHGDISLLRQKAFRDKKWHILTDLLNSSPEVKARSTEKWIKSWSDYKNYIRKKIQKINSYNGPKEDVPVVITELEERVLKIMEKNILKIKLEHPVPQNVTTTMSQFCGTFEDSYHMRDITLSCKQPIDINLSCKQHEQPIHEQPILEQSINEQSIHDEPVNDHSADDQPIDEQPVDDVRKKRKNRRLSTSSSDSRSSRSSLSPKRRKKLFKINLQDMAVKYLDFERDRANMEHEREMARIKQNDKLVNIFGRIVNVLETLAPSIQNYLDRNASDK